ncbi:MAG: lyase family protein [Balneolales bacterium]
MKTLWQKNQGSFTGTSGSVPDRSWFYRFTVEGDRELDRNLIPYDILVNIAQARMLRKIGVYDERGSSKVIRVLEEAYRQWTQGRFEIGPDDEDVHSAIENLLTTKAGQDGARIHTGRSRNDQVLADMRMYMKDVICEIFVDWLAIARRLEALAKKYNGVFFTGLTHTQPAMPHSADAWATGYMDLLLSDLQALQHSYVEADCSPLGSAAGFGVPYIRIDREFIAKELGFARVQEPVAAAQLSRGRIELQLIDALSYGALTFNRLASDVVLFMHPSWSLIRLSEDQVSGSSIMPQKRNPDVWELIRGAYHDLQAARVQLAGISANLPSGYHRDLQLVKKGLMVAVGQSKQLAVAVRHALNGLEFDKEAATKSLRPEIFATHRANELVAGGMPFREAYRLVATESQKTSEHANYVDQRQEKDNKTSSGSSSIPDIGKYFHSGAPGSGVPGYLSDRLNEAELWIEKQNKRAEQFRSKL